jgi:hypothetical protein
MKVAIVQTLLAMSTAYSLTKAYQADMFTYSGFPEDAENCQGSTTSDIWTTAYSGCIRTLAASQCIAIITNSPSGVVFKLYTSGYCQDYKSGDQ